MSSYWVPWLMKNGKQDVILLLGERFTSTEQITQFWLHMPRTHPHLVGEHIEFIEMTDRDLTKAPST